LVEQLAKQLRSLTDHGKNQDSKIVQSVGRSVISQDLTKPSWSTDRLVAQEGASNQRDLSLSLSAISVSLYLAICLFIFVVSVVC